MTNDRITIGSVAALNNLVLKSATGKTPFTGAVYSIRPSALAPLAGAAAAVDPSAAMFAGMAGAVLSGIGDIHAVDTIRDGVRDTHILMREPSGEVPAMVMPGMNPVQPGAVKPAAPSDSGDEAEEEEEEEEEEPAEDEEDEDKPSAGAESDDEWTSDDWE